MRNYARALRAGACAVLVVQGFTAAASTAAPAPRPLPEARSFLVLGDGRELWSRDADTPLPPASLTKLMTVLIALDRLAPGAQVTAGPGAAGESGSRMDLKAGDRLAATDLAAAALVASANDACRALAEAVAGSQSAFVDVMNAQARTWGLSASHFTNACGHDQPGHLASARDLAALAERALQDARIASWVALPQLEVRTTDGQRRFLLHNTNALIGRYDGAIGVKSGYTAKAGKCLIAAAQRGGHRVLLVLLHGSNRWWDASDTLDHAFAELDARP